MVPPAARACTAEDLSTTTCVDGGGVVGGRWVQTLVVSTVSDSTCTLAGSAQIRGIALRTTAQVAHPDSGVAVEITGTKFS